MIKTVLAVVLTIACVSMFVADAAVCPGYVCLTAGQSYGSTSITDRQFVCPTGTFVNVTTTISTSGFYYNGTCTTITKSIGSACGGASDGNCPTGSSCTLTAGTTTYACAVAGYLGDSCTSNFGCLYPRTCSGNICVTSVAVGGSCATVSGVTPICPINSYCGSSSTCVTTPALGAACPDGQCGGTSTCVNAVCVAPQTQANGVNVNGAEVACASLATNSSGYCAPNSFVSVLGKTCTQATSATDCGSNGYCVCTVTMAAAGANTFQCINTPNTDLPISLYPAFAALQTSTYPSCENGPSFNGIPSSTSCAVRVAASQTRAVVCQVWAFEFGTVSALNNPCSTAATSYCNSAFGRFQLSIGAIIAVALAALAQL